MDASGPIFVVLVVACLFYLVPRRLSWRIPTPEEVDQKAPSHQGVRTVHVGVPVGADPDAPGVSTGLTRRAGRRTAMRLARQAEKRRAGVFVALLVILALAGVLAFFRLMGWWVPLPVAAAVVGWVVFSRFEARRVRRQLDAIMADIELGDDEKTMAVALPAKVTTPITESAIVGPNGDVQLSLWDPITVVPATYISAPTAARTVRTIDLAPPVKHPPTANRPARDVDEDDEDSGRIAV